MKVAMGQFAVQRDWQENAAVCIDLMARAAADGADLLVLPEGVLARDITDVHLVLEAAQPLSGPFVSQLRGQSQKDMLTTILCLYVPSGDRRVKNVLIALRGGEIIAQYEKLHLYDAFSVQESQWVDAGESIPPLIDVAGMKVGLMTCYDLRFPEMARRLAFDGAEVLVLPAGWVQGAHKEMHWELLTAARALENTCYMVAVGECGPRNIGNSLVVDPLGVVIAKAAEAPALMFAELDPARLSHARRVLPVLNHLRFAYPELKTS